MQAERYPKRRIRLMRAGTRLHDVSTTWEHSGEPVRTSDEWKGSRTDDLSTGCDHNLHAINKFPELPQ